MEEVWWCRECRKKKVKERMKAFDIRTEKKRLTVTERGEDRWNWRNSKFNWEREEWIPFLILFLFLLRWRYRAEPLICTLSPQCGHVSSSLFYPNNIFISLSKLLPYLKILFCYGRIYTNIYLIIKNALYILFEHAFS